MSYFGYHNVKTRFIGYDGPLVDICFGNISIFDSPSNALHINRTILRPNPILFIAGISIAPIFTLVRLYLVSSIASFCMICCKTVSFITVLSVSFALTSSHKPCLFCFMKYGRYRSSVFPYTYHECR